MELRIICTLGSDLQEGSERTVSTVLAAEFLGEGFTLCHPYCDRLVLQVLLVKFQGFSNGLLRGELNECVSTSHQIISRRFDRDKKNNCA